MFPVDKGKDVIYNSLKAETRERNRKGLMSERELVLGSQEAKCASKSPDGPRDLTLPSKSDALGVGT